MPLLLLRIVLLFRGRRVLGHRVLLFVLLSVAALLGLLRSLVVSSLLFCRLLLLVGSGGGRSLLGQRTPHHAEREGYANEQSESLLHGVTSFPSCGSRFLTGLSTV